MTREQLVLDQIEIDGPWPVTFTWRDHPGKVVMHVERVDTLTGKLGTIELNSRTIPGPATESTLARTAFGLYVGFSEHEARESFQFKGRRVFGPHTSVAALWEAAESTEG